MPLLILVLTLAPAAGRRLRLFRSLTKENTFGAFFLLAHYTEPATTHDLLGSGRWRFLHPLIRQKEQDSFWSSFTARTTFASQKIWFSRHEATPKKNHPRGVVILWPTVIDELSNYCCNFLIASEYHSGSAAIP